MFEVFQYGDYEGTDIEDMIDSDPAYVVFAYVNMPGIGVSYEQYDRALAMLNDWDGNTSEYEDQIDIENDFGLMVGYVSDDY